MSLQVLAHHPSSARGGDDGPLPKPAGRSEATGQRFHDLLHSDSARAQEPGHGRAVSSDQAPVAPRGRRHAPAMDSDAAGARSAPGPAIGATDQAFGFAALGPFARVAPINHGQDATGVSPGEAAVGARNDPAAGAPPGPLARLVTPTLASASDFGQPAGRSGAAAFLFADTRAAVGASAISAQAGVQQGAEDILPIDELQPQAPPARATTAPSRSSQAQANIVLSVEEGAASIALAWPAATGAEALALRDAVRQAVAAHGLELHELVLSGSVVHEDSQADGGSHGGRRR